MSGTKLWSVYNDTIQIAAIMVKQNSWSYDQAASKAKLELLKRGIMSHESGLMNDIKNRADSMGEAEVNWFKQRM